MLTKAEIARLRSLQEKKQREALGLFVVEGEKVINELLQAGLAVLELYATENSTYQPTSDKNPRFVHRTVSKEEMARISHFPTPSTLLAVGKLERRPLSPATLNHGLTLALDAVQDAGNVGTLLRIADWFKLDRVVLSPDCADLFSQKVINASMGSFARVAVHTASLEEALGDIQVPVFGCDLNGENVHALLPRSDAVLVIGNEGRGLSAAVRARVTQFITIPRYGAAESLNAAVAAAIVCDNLRRVGAP